MSDPLTRRLRDQIAHEDRAILHAANRRLRLVAELQSHKQRKGLDFVDPVQEERLLEALEEANPGPLSSAAVRRLFREILALTKGELR